ncbi:dTDP-4-dehydrorhamnose reductase [Candidatus Gracilibacteria bacterium]|nr:dTDP-4-dehydrorhamnose reductase [Candidatus Gracilibacteria bacterium]
MTKKKILITGGNGMLAYDFIRTQREKYDIIAVDRDACDITSFESILQNISLYEPDIVLNCAAYTAVDDAEDIGMQMCYEVNTLGVYNLARATAVFGIEFITISTDYVFDGKDPAGYFPTDECKPIGAYGMSKYLGEKLATQVNPRTIVVRTSWLYGGNKYGSLTGVFGNFVNTMIRLSETQSELKIVNDQHGIPTSCIDLSFAISEIIENIEEREYVGQFFHFSNSSKEGSITWADFAREIFYSIGKNIQVIECSSNEYITKAKRPEWSILKNNSSIILLDWKIGLARYLGK